jgi:hypothetical protein
MKQPRTTMAPGGKVVHLVAHRHHADGSLTVLCDEPVPAYREPEPDARLCDPCGTTLQQLQEAAATLPR